MTEKAKDRATVLALAALSIMRDALLQTAKLNNINSAYVELVTVTTIDKVIQGQNFFGNGLIKMDIEGFEMKALEGAKNTLRTLKPSLAIAVYHEYENANKCAEIIKNANPEYKIELRGCYGYFKPARPYMLFAW